MPRRARAATLRGRKVVATPLLFPGDGFVRIELQWTAATKAVGVVRLIGNGTPTPVPEGIVPALKASEGADGLISLPRPSRYARGDRVRVLRGPFVGNVGLFIELRPRERVFYCCRG